MVLLEKVISDCIIKELDRVRKEVNVNPTEKQKVAGNYKKGHIVYNGFAITIENPKGSYRRGTDDDGKKWSVYMNNDYGYFTKTLGKDNDPIDVFLGYNPYSDKVFVVDQVIDGKFDESKVMLGFNFAEEAKQAYMSNYNSGWQGFDTITEVDIETFKNWLYDGVKQVKPFHEYKSLFKKNKKKENKNSLRHIVRDAIKKVMKESNHF